MTREEAIKLLDEHVAALMEHFDAVQILASDYDGDCTRFTPRGGGNFFARKGMCDTFLKRDEADDAAGYLAQAIKGEDE